MTSKEDSEQLKNFYKTWKIKDEMSKCRFFKMSEISITILLLMLPSCHAMSENLVCGGEIQTYVCLPKNYSSMGIPLTDRPNTISIEIHISDILKINDRDFSITFSLYFNVKWKEPRLNLNPIFFQNRSMEVDQLNPVDLNLINDLWVPNVFIYNLKTFKVIDVLSKLAGLWVNAHKEIMYSQASQITFICPMVFNTFPLDTQICKFQVGSYSYNMEKMIFEVSQLGYAHTSRSIVLDYGIEINELRQEDRIFVGGPLGNYSLAGFEMILVRHISHYIINYYLPSGLFVVVSWISFLVPADVIPGRMALLVTLFLVLVNIFNTVTTNTPKAEGLTAIEAWMLACILFVFGALTEYACLLFSRGMLDEDDEEDEAYQKKQRRKNEGTPPGVKVGTVCINGDGDELTDLTTNAPKEIDTEISGGDTFRVLPISRAMHNKRIAKQSKKRYAKIDRFCLAAFPLLFGLFNTCYWLSYYRR